MADGTKRDRGGRYKPGSSGNPNGRPLGSGVAGAVRGMLESRKDELVAKALEMAMDGDGAALRLCMERVCPPLKATDTPVNIEGLEGSLAQQGRQIIQAAGNGELTPSEASHFLQALAAQSKVTEMDELERRIAALEKQSERS